MMSSLGGDKARGPREKALPAATHTSQPQKQIQATAEQIRLAQVIYDKNDADFEDKVNQLMEVTGKNQDECMVALHDCNEDVSRAINFLLESTSDMTSWETVGKKKPLVKEGPSDSKENKENREKKGEREASKGRPAANRKGRGASRGRQARPEENGVEVMPVDRGSDRGRRARGGGRGSGGRGRGPPGSRFSAQGMGIFNPADYTSEAGSGTTQTEVWDTVANNSTDGTVTWRPTMEDWASEEWSEDVSLSETKVFTSKCAPAAENHITPGQSLDLASLLQKPVVGGREPPSSSSPQSLVFTNSHHHQAPQQQPPHSRNANSSTSYAHAALSSVLGAGFGDLGQAKRTQPSAGAQILEQLKGPGLGPLPSSQATPPASTQGSNTSIGRLPGLGAPVPPPSSSSWDIKLSESTSLSSQFSREFGLQPEPSLVLSQLVQRHTGPSLPLARQPSPPSQQQTPPASASPAPHHTSSPAQTGLVMAVTGAKPPAPGTGLDPQGGSTPQQQRAQFKAPKRRIPPTSKIPSTAVEMPGSADIPGLNLQFGALDFGSESAMPEFGVVDKCASAASRESTPAPCPAPPLNGAGTLSQTSLYSKPLSESLGNPLSVALPLPLSSSEPVYHSSVPLPSLTPSSLVTANSSNPPSCSSTAPTTSSSVPSSSHFSTVGGSYDGTMPPHTRLAFSQSKEATGPVMNGLNGVRTSVALDTSSASSTPKPESPSMNITNGTSAPSSLLPSTLPAHNSTTLSNLAQDMPSASHLNSLNSHVSNHSSVSALGSSSLTYTSVDNSSVNCLAPSTGSYSSSQPSALHSTHNSSNSSSSGISHLANMGNNMSSTVAGIVGISGLHSAAIAASTALGLGSNGATATSNLSAPRTTPLLSSSTGKAPPNLSQGVPPLLPNQYIMGPGGLLPAYPQIYGYEDLHMLQSRLPMPSLQDYYGITFPGPTATLSGRDGSLANNPYSGEVTKFGRNDSTSPAPPTSLAAPQPPQGQSQGQSQAQPQPPQAQGQPQHHSSQQAFLPPGYSYTGLPYYAGVPGAVPSAAAFQYGHTMFVPPGGPGPASAKQHAMGLGLGNPSASPFQQQTQQQSSGYSQHTFSSGYEELTAGPAGVDYSKGYNSSSQAQAKSAASGPGKGVSVTSSNSGVPDISGSVYNKTQSFDKQGFHAGTPPPFSLPSALGGPGPLNPGAAPGGYAPAPFLHILPHQQPHSQLLHHHLAQDGQGGPSQRGQSSSLQQKSQVNKSSYGSSPYWAN
ncbi:ubiquitin-associated protein 2a isoform X1 [Etheostoma cragini]|uniref:ubiquitin-associated protein 2a isoform X1 n=1 Tax=Etheostoma cragini TaxID=417921 RepID=UPI00155F52E9|nr:ubiquitin-associated protein 2a isoform X1 [Etheostoma cragini]XP_034725792.1 ubiquitin-associated protein 2a isoform X1 [Etheostoma cragini]